MPTKMTAGGNILGCRNCPDTCNPVRRVPMTPMSAILMPAVPPRLPRTTEGSTSCWRSLEAEREQETGTKNGDENESNLAHLLSQPELGRALEIALLGPSRPASPTSLAVLGFCTKLVVRMTGVVNNRGQGAGQIYTNCAYPLIVRRVISERTHASLAASLEPGGRVRIFSPSRAARCLLLVFHVLKAINTY